MEEEGQEFSEASKIPKRGELGSLPAGSQLGELTASMLRPKGIVFGCCEDH